MPKTLSHLMLPEFDREMPRTRKVLAALTPESLSWQADEKLRSIGWNANHIADLIGWTPQIIANDEFDMAPLEGPKPEVPSLEDPAEILNAFDTAVTQARAAIEAATDEQLAEDWSLKSGGQTLFTISKGECLRTWVLNHTVHHRAILSVYLRMNGIELTPVYDE
ncbi:DinB family protein [Stieleria varia]|uniref:DinB family protein n=1 Tax=Stieleria varia TaxID=2528005 RepID=A0A5C6B681_9BACT|nr:DinB family protein [Stieleria varia]TWU07458.1 DinB family protein [Stieleria varia]